MDDYVADSTSQANGLIEWKSSLDARSQQVLSSWTFAPNNGSPCNWLGVMCHHGDSITVINLTSLSLRGNLDKFPFSLSTLAYLKLNMNHLFGTIPPHIGNLTHELLFLDLSSNYPSGAIPQEFGRLTNVKKVLLYHNLFNGSILIFVANMSNLCYFYAYVNDFSGSIPPEIGNLPKLIGLDLSWNSLTGPIPSTFRNLTKCTLVHLFCNLLSGLIPHEVSNMESLISLSLENNSLSDSIPASIGSLG